MAHNTVIVFMTLLIAAVIIILCVLFGSESCLTALSLYWNQHIRVRVDTAQKAY